jgi:pimeloyl-[acyl-carrier protein] methyl ester esterase
LTPPGAGAWLAAALPHARLAVIKEAAHVPFLSHAQAFDAALAAFLTDTRDGR